MRRDSTKVFTEAETGAKGAKSLNLEPKLFVVNSNDPRFSWVAALDKWALRHILVMVVRHLGGLNIYPTLICGGLCPSS